MRLCSLQSAVIQPGTDDPKVEREKERERERKKCVTKDYAKQPFEDEGK